jgi:hypothetical protein
VVGLKRVLPAAPRADFRSADEQCAGLDGLLHDAVTQRADIDFKRRGDAEPFNFGKHRS